MTLPNLLKEHDSQTHGLTEIKNNETPTRGIKHLGLDVYSSILPRTKIGVTGQESSPQSPTISYRHPLPASLENRPNIKIMYIWQQYVILKDG